MWDIYLSNEKATSSFIAAGLSMFNSAFYVKPKGNVMFNRELLSNVRCPMDLLFYPHDIQLCSMTFQSYSLGDKEMNLTSKGSEIRHLDLASFGIHFSSRIKCVIKKTGDGDTKSTTLFILGIKLERKTDFFLSQVGKQQTYFPFKK